MPSKQKIAPCLWFDDNAEEAVKFYLSIFRESKMVNIQRYGETGPGEPGTVMAIDFELEGQEFVALNGGPKFRFNEAISMFVKCDSQEEVDYYWDKLTADGGQPVQCGWLKDKFGLSWQVVPNTLGEMLQDEDRERANRVMAAVLEMEKIDVTALEDAYNRKK